MSVDLISLLTDRREQHSVVWLFNIGAERLWNDQDQTIRDKYEEMLVSSIEEINLLLVRKQDILILRKKPDPLFLEDLVKYGFEVPAILYPQADDCSLTISELVLQDNELLLTLKGLAQDQDEVLFVPYAVTYLEEQISSYCGLRMIGSPASVNRIVNDKVFNRELASRLGLAIAEGNVCNSLEELVLEYDKLIQSKEGFKKVIVKDPYGASGKGLYLIDSREQLIFLFRKKKNKAWLMEGWYEKSKDLNYQIYVSANGEVRVFSVKEQILDGTVYLGSKFPCEADGYLDEITQCGRLIGEYLHSMHFSGVAGIDAVVTSRGLLLPLIEINGRFTLSTYLSFIERRLGQRKISSRYFRLAVQHPVTYLQLRKLFSEQGILFDERDQRGVIIYNSSCLPNGDVTANGVILGRLFVLIVSEDWEANREYTHRLIALLEQLGQMQVTKPHNGGIQDQCFL